MSKYFAHVKTAETAFGMLPEKLQRFFTRYPPAPLRAYADKPTSTDAPDANPFLANKHPITGKYHEPVYSLRRQSDLYKLAYKFGVADLMPTLMHNKKFFAEKQAESPVLKGVLAPKGHKWERTYAQRQQKIADAVAKADDLLIQNRGQKYRRRLENREAEKKTWV